MGSWYRVTKKINGRLYDYWQRTSSGAFCETEDKGHQSTKSISRPSHKEALTAILRFESLGHLLFLHYLLEGRSSPQTTGRPFRLARALP